MPTRKQLIDDWQKSLAEASAPENSTADVVASPRSAWLVRVRQRLYRFLLSLYGDGSWNAPLPREVIESSVTAMPADEANSNTLLRKPTKDIRQIRAALESCADARGKRNEMGPLAASSDAGPWVIVASSSGDFDPVLCMRLLESRGLAPRLVAHRNDVTVEVRSPFESLAIKTIHSRIGQLRRYTVPCVPSYPSLVDSVAEVVVRWNSRIPGRWKFILFSLLLPVCTLPIALLGVLATSLLQNAQGDPLINLDDSDVEHLWTVWRGLFIISLLVVWLRADRQSRKKQASKNSVTHASTLRVPQTLRPVQPPSVLVAKQVERRPEYPYQPQPSHVHVAPAVAKSYSQYLTAGFLLGPMFSLLVICLLHVYWPTSGSPPPGLLFGATMILCATCPLLAILLHATIRRRIR